MAYTTNPRIGQVRYEAYCLVHYHHWTTREVARHLGYAQSPIVKWSKGKPEERLYVYTLLDVCSRWAYAWACHRINTFRSVQFLGLAKKAAPFALTTLQSDHGSEFSKRFTTRMRRQGISHRHSRIRRPTDNGHLERFNRTLQQECLHRIPRSFKSWSKEIPHYLRYYNHERPHMALGFKTPVEVITSY